jgi:hypothetical protein
MRHLLLRLKKHFLIVSFLILGTLLFAKPITIDDSVIVQLSTALQQTTDQLKASNDKISSLEKEKDALQTENNNWSSTLKFFQTLDPSITDYAGIKLYFANTILPSLEANSDIIKQMKDVITKVDQMEINTLRDDITKTLIPNTNLIVKDLQDLLKLYTETKYFAFGAGVNYSLPNTFGANILFTFNIPIVPINVYAGAGISFSISPSAYLSAGVQVRF